jgi:hypothetical protein
MGSFEAYCIFVAPHILHLLNPSSEQASGGNGVLTSHVRINKAIDRGVERYNLYT